MTKRPVYGEMKYSSGLPMPLKSNENLTLMPNCSIPQIIIMAVIKTRCRPSMGRQCIPVVELKNEGPMEQTCRSINVHVVNTNSYMLGPTSMFMDCLRKQTHQCTQ